jgi:hypothetical protein
MPKKRGRPRKTPVEEPVVTYVPEPGAEPDTLEEADGKPQMTSIQLTPAVRDRLWKLKFRKTYDAFLAELCDLYEANHQE